MQFAGRLPTHPVLTLSRLTPNTDVLDCCLARLTVDNVRDIHMKGGSILKARSLVEQPMCSPSLGLLVHEGRERKAGTKCMCSGGPEVLRYGTAEMLQSSPSALSLSRRTQTQKYFSGPEDRLWAGIKQKCKQTCSAVT